MRLAVKILKQRNQKLQKLKNMNDVKLEFKTITLFIIDGSFLFTTYYVYHILFFLFATLTFGAFGFTMTLAVEWHLWKCNFSLILKANTPLVYPVGTTIFFFGFTAFVSTPKPEAMVVCLPTNLTCISWYMGYWCRSLRFPYSAMHFGRWRRKFSCYP